MIRAPVSETRVLSVLTVLTAVMGFVCLMVMLRPLPERIAKNFPETAASVDSDLPQPVPTELFLPYVWRLVDIYETDGLRLRLREAPVKRVSAMLDLAWEGARQARVQVSPDPQFAGERLHFQAGAAALTLNSLYLGENFWRVSRDGRLWSASLRFVVEPEFLMERLSLVYEGARLRITGPHLSAYIVEFSPTPFFEPRNTFVFSVQKSRLDWDPEQKGYLRVRGVNASRELTAYSDVIKSGQL